MTTVQTQTVHELLDNGAADAVAIAAVERPSLSFAQLRTLVRDTVVALNQLGYGRGDAIAIVLPNGPEMATAFLSVSSAAVCAPLNPSYRAAEFEFYFSDLPAKALMIGGLADSPAREVARRAGLKVIELEWTPEDRREALAVLTLRRASAMPVMRLVVVAPAGWTTRAGSIAEARSRAPPAAR